MITHKTCSSQSHQNVATPTALNNPEERIVTDRGKKTICGLAAHAVTAHSLGLLGLAAHAVTVRWPLLGFPSLSA